MPTTWSTILITESLNSIVSELLSEILRAGVRESEFDERIPAGDFLIHVPYWLRRN